MPRPPVKVAPVKPAGPPRALIGTVVVAAVAVIALIVWLAVRGGGDTSTAVGSPSTIAGGGGIQEPFPAKTGVPQIHLYEDFQCPGCGQLERTSGAAFTKAAADGKVQLTYTMMSFLDGNLRNDASSRAANAALCADDKGVFAAYHSAVYANQPQNEGDGWSDEQLVGFGTTAGISAADLPSFSSCVMKGTHLGYVEAMQNQANKDGVSGTPRIYLDGTELTDTEMGQLQTDPAALDAILAAHR